MDRLIIKTFFFGQRRYVYSKGLVLYNLSYMAQLYIFVFTMQRPLWFSDGDSCLGVSTNYQDKHQKKSFMALVKKKQRMQSQKL